jgi:hypothetical protein
VNDGPVTICLDSSETQLTRPPGKVHGGGKAGKGGRGAQGGQGKGETPRGPSPSVPLPPPPSSGESLVGPPDPLPADVAGEEVDASA